MANTKSKILIPRISPDCGDPIGGMPTAAAVSRMIPGNDLTASHGG